MLGLRPQSGRWSPGPEEVYDTARVGPCLRGCAWIAPQAPPYYFGIDA